MASRTPQKITEKLPVQVLRHKYAARMKIVFWSFRFSACYDTQTKRPV